MLRRRIPLHVWLRHYGIVPVLDSDFDDIEWVRRQYQMFGKVSMDVTLGDTRGSGNPSIYEPERDAPVSEDRLPYYERRRRELRRLHNTPEEIAAREERRQRQSEYNQQRKIELQHIRKAYAEKQAKRLAEIRRRDADWAQAEFERKARQAEAARRLNQLDFDDPPDYLAQRRDPRDEKRRQNWLKIHRGLAKRLGCKRGTAWVGNDKLGFAAWK